MPDGADSLAQATNRDKENRFVRTEASIREETVTVLDTYAPNNRASKHTPHHQ